MSSLVNNIGLDGSGENCDRSNSYNNERLGAIDNNFNLAQEGELIENTLAVN